MWSIQSFSTINAAMHDETGSLTWYLHRQKRLIRYEPFPYVLQNILYYYILLSWALSSLHIMNGKINSSCCYLWYCTAICWNNCWLHRDISGIQFSKKKKIPFYHLISEISIFAYSFFVVSLKAVFVECFCIHFSFPNYFFRHMYVSLSLFLLLTFINTLICFSPLYPIRFIFICIPLLLYHKIKVLNI